MTHGHDPGLANEALMPYTVQRLVQCRASIQVDILTTLRIWRYALRELLLRILTLRELGQWAMTIGTLQELEGRN